MTLLKIYLYGYLNRIQSSRRLECEAARNIELMWLTGRLAQDFKTIADFRRANGSAIRAVCARFVVIYGQLGLFSHSRSPPSTEAADLQEGERTEAKARRLRDKIAAMKTKLSELKELETAVMEAPDQQISLTDPDARAMATSLRGAGVVGYNVQAAVDTEHHLIVAHDVTNIVTDRTLLSQMARMAKVAMAVENIYFSGEEILSCEAIGATPHVPKPLTSNAKAAGRLARTISSICRSERLSMLGGRDPHLSIHARRGGTNAAQLMDQQVRHLRIAGEVHDQQGAPRQSLGA